MIIFPKWYYYIGKVKEADNIKGVITRKLPGGHPMPSFLTEIGLTLFPCKKKSTTFSNSGPSWTRKMLKIVLESPQKLREGISLT